MLGPRWRKVYRDLLSNLIRTVLVVLSVAVGVFAVGLIFGSYEILSRDLHDSYMAVNPANAVIYTGDPFDRDLVQSIQDMREVNEAEGRRSVFARLQVHPDNWRDLLLVAIDDYRDIRVNKIGSESGAWPPPERSLLVERAALGMLGVSAGDVVLLEMPDGRRRELRIAGLAHDLTRDPPLLAGTAYGYITFETLEWLGEPRNFNELYITVKAPQDIDHAREVMSHVQDKLERSGISVDRAWVPTPGKHPMSDMIQTMLLILGVLGFFSLLLSGSLVFNTINALLTRQIRQVGIMKAIGARTGQIMGMYSMAVLCYGLLSLFVAIPLANLATRWITDYVAHLLNFDIISFSIPSRVYALEASVGLAAPLLAALFPIIAGARVTVQQAISTYGLDAKWPGTTWIDRLLTQVRGLSRPLLLSLRNTFRCKGRLALTLAPLMLSCAIFIAVSSVRDSLRLTLEETLERWNDDIMVRFARSHRVNRLEQEALNVAGVVAVEVWGDVIACRVRPDGSQSANILVYAPPAGTHMFLPAVLQGRWLAPEDGNAIVINAGLLRDEPDLDIGDEMVLKIRGRDSVWTVVGIVQGGGALEGSFAYINRPYWERSVGEIGQANRVHIVTEQHSSDFQTQVARVLEERFDRAGIRIAGTYIATETRTRIATAFNVVIVFLWLMAVLLAWVGGLGLMGIMSINVLERTREIGVMRAIGADNHSIWQIFIVEGVFIGVMSWFLGCGIAVPLSKLFSEVVGMTLMNTSPAYEFSVGGALVWLGLAVVIAALASFVPAWNASRISVSEALTYE